MFALKSVSVDGPMPLASIEVELRPGLNALYGRNGAGKSRLLAQVDAVLRGNREGQPIVVVPTDADALATMIEKSQELWRKAFSIEPVRWAGEDRMPWQKPEIERLKRVLGDILTERWLNSASRLSWDDAEVERPPARDVVYEIAQFGDLVLRKNAGAWNLDLGIRRGAHTPALNALAARMLGSWDGFVDQLDDVDALLNDSEDADHASFQAWLASFDARDFFTVFGPLPRFAIDDWWTWGDERPLGYTDFGGFWDKMTALRDPRSVMVLTGWFAGEAVVEKVRPPGFGSAATDSGAAEDGFAKETLKAVSAVAKFRYLCERVGDPDVVFGTSAPFLEIADGAVVPATWLTATLADLADRANSLLRSMLPDAPKLICSVEAPESWALGPMASWRALDVSGSTVELADLSAAQLRLVRLTLDLVIGQCEQVHDDAVWSSFGGELAFDDPWAGSLQPNGAVTSTILLDEPEAGLHALAEDRLTDALVDYGVAHGIAVVAATHSRAFLRNPRVHLTEVYRSSSGRTQTRVVEFPQEANAAELGVSRADLLQLVEVVLLVEGRHDEVLLGESLGHELKRRRALVVPLRGAKNLKALVDLQILTDTLDVPCVVVLDGSNAERIDGLWSALKAIPPDSNPEIVEAIAARLLGDAPTDEEGQVLSLARRLHATGQLDRFVTFGLSRRDIVEYYPPERFFSDAPAWSTLREAHAVAVAASPKPARDVRDFKRWLTKTYRASFDDDTLRIAAASVATPPQEFLELLARIDSATDRWRG